MTNQRPCRVGDTVPLWWITRDGDASCLRLYERHYSAYQYKDGRIRKLFCGPGEKVVLRTAAGDACFVWRRFIDGCKDERTGARQEGVNCAVFRNESQYRSSELIRQADAIADCIWPGQRHYTYVRQENVRSSNPGFCFIMAGWRRLRQRTKSGLRILERVTRCGQCGKSVPSECKCFEDSETGGE